MAITSNLYASRVFSEHSIATWPLDDDVTYISLINETDRSFDSWNITNGTYTDYLPFPDNPFPDGPFPKNTFTELISSDSDFETIAYSSTIFNLQDLNQDLNTFAINAYFYSENTPLYYKYGYRYLDPFTGTWIEDTVTTDLPTSLAWQRVEATFNPPNVNAIAQLVFKVKFDGGTNPSVIMNGISVGQWSENTSNKTLGVTPSTTDPELESLLGPIVGVKTEAYGISAKDGYILAEDGKLLAINHGIPMVFGSDNVTRLNYSNNLPSVVMPSCGALNESGRYGEFTVEMWIRIENNYFLPQRIWGPINSDYGLYVKRGYLTLVIGNEIGSYFVANWYRPMLVHIILRENAAAVMINGEQVISLSYDSSSLTLPDIDEDWMGFYCHPTMPLFEIDCVSVLPYIIPATVAKRRFVWGQGVESPETINSAYEGTIAYIDYPYAQYTANIQYPEAARWDTAYFENLTVTNRSISTPLYTLPRIEKGEKTDQQLYDDNKTFNDEEYPIALSQIISASASAPEEGYVTYQTASAHAFELSDKVQITGASIAEFNTTSVIKNVPTSDTFVVTNSASGSPTFSNGLAQRIHQKFISFRPNETWTDPSYYLFETLNVITDVVRGIWAVFETESSTIGPEPLMKFRNTITDDYLIIYLEGSTVYYKLYQNGIQHPLAFEFEITPNQHFVVGFHLPRLLAAYGSIIGEFFGNPSAIEVYVGGDGVNTFSGMIYRVGFSNQRNLDEIDTHFQSDGIAILSDGALLDDHLGSYTLVALEDYNRFFLDIAVSSYWEEYYPLSKLAGYVSDTNDNSYLDVDFLQYNIGYPTTTTTVENTVTGSWTYSELAYAYANPYIRTYEALDNALISGYESYLELQNKTNTFIDYDFSQSSVRSYITFQKISNGANKTLADYVNATSLPATNVLDVPTYQDIFSTKFEVKDNAIIYPPKNFGIDDTAMVVHLDIKVNGILKNPLNIRKMGIVSEALGSGTFNEIGTRFGPKLYPYSKTGIYFDNKSKNPYSIYKDSTPYLFLTKNSGIESLGLREFEVERGISMPINSQAVSGQKVSAMQIWMKYSDENFPQIDTTLFSIDSANVEIGFNVVTDQSANRGKIYAIDLTTRQQYTKLTFYQDGIPVVTPYLEKNKWTVIGINFSTPLNFSSYVGAINLFQSAVFNNIAYYKASSLQESQSIVNRRWENIDGTPLTPLDWYYWRGQDPGPYGLWDNVLKLAETNLYGVNPETLFKSYSGTNRQIIDDNRGLTVTETGVTVLAGAEWSTYNQKPV